METINAKIYLVGESEAFLAGGSGRVLSSLLMDSGIHKDSCRIGLISNGIEKLFEDIKKVNPNVVCCFGNYALMAMMKLEGVGKWRGSILWHKQLNVKIIPTISPSIVIKMWDYCPLVLFDLRRVFVESKTKEREQLDYDFIISPSFKQTLNELERLMGCEKIAYDIETTRDTPPIITAIAISSSPKSGICIPFTKSSGVDIVNYWTFEEEFIIWERLKHLLEDESVGKIAQNAQFDNTVLEVSYPKIRVKNLVLDTMCAHHTVYPELPKSLATITSIYTKQPYYKHWIKSGNDELFWRYNCMDASVTFSSAIAIEQEMREFNVFNFYHTYVHPLIQILGDIQIRGIKIDEGLMEDAKTKTNRELVELQTKLNDVTGMNINVMSPKQLKEFIYGDLGLSPIINRTTRKVTVNEEALMKLAFKHQSPIFGLILAIRKRKKLLGTYLEGLVGFDGRTRCAYIIGGDKEGEGGTETGRLSSRKGVLGEGTNLQNIPPGVCRKMFIPDKPSQSFVSSDLSQAEARVVACLAEEVRLIKLFKEGGDIHKKNASWIFHKPIGKVTPNERTLAKRLVHASNYGIGPNAFAHHANISKQEAQELLNTYFDTFPFIQAWQLKIRSELSKYKLMESPLGRKRMFFGRYGEQLLRTAFAYVPQSTVADLLNLALIRFVGLTEGLGDGFAPVILQVHDSFIVQCEDSNIELVKQMMKTAFNIPIRINGNRLLIPIDIKVGKNWEDMK